MDEEFLRECEWRDNLFPERELELLRLVRLSSSEVACQAVALCEGWEGGGG